MKQKNEKKKTFFFKCIFEKSFIFFFIKKRRKKPNKKKFKKLLKIIFFLYPKIFREKNIWKKQNSAFLLVFPIKEMSLWPELSSPTPFPNQGGVSDITD